MPVYYGYMTEGQKDMLQRVLHRASCRGFTPYYYDLDILAEKAQYDLFTIAVAKTLHASLVHSKTQAFRCHAVKNTWS